MLQNLTIDGTNIYDKFKIWVYKVDKVVDIPPLRSLDVHYWTESNIPDVAWELQTLDVKTYDIEFYAKDVRYLEYFIGFIGVKTRTWQFRNIGYPVRLRYLAHTQIKVVQNLASFSIKVQEDEVNRLLHSPIELIDNIEATRNDYNIPTTNYTLINEFKDEYGIVTNKSYDISDFGCRVLDGTNEQFLKCSENVNLGGYVIENLDGYIYSPHVRFAKNATARNVTLHLLFKAKNITNLTINREAFMFFITARVPHYITTPIASDVKVMYLYDKCNTIEYYVDGLGSVWWKTDISINILNYYAFGKYTEYSNEIINEPVIR